MRKSAKADLRARPSKDDGPCGAACAPVAPLRPIILRGSLRSRLRMTGTKIELSDEALAPPCAVLRPRRRSVGPQRHFADLAPAQLNDARRDDAVRRANDDRDHVAGCGARG